VSKYYNAVKEYQKEGKYTELGEIIVTSLPRKKWGRPLLIEDQLDKQVQSYVFATRDAIKSSPITVEDQLGSLDIGEIFALLYGLR